jgi:hypothetical protein
MHQAQSYEDQHHGTSGTAHSLLNVDILERSFNLVFRDGG